MSRISLNLMVLRYGLDRRHKYFIYDGLICYDGKFTQACSGCSDDREYVTSEQGSGCNWCGYTGKGIQHFPIPVCDLKGNKI